VTENAPNVGMFGGRCICPNGQKYWVGAIDNDCSQLACINGRTAFNEVKYDTTNVGLKGALCQCPNGESYPVGEDITNASIQGFFACANGAVTKILTMGQELFTIGPKLLSLQPTISEIPMTIKFINEGNIELQVFRLGATKDEPRGNIERSRISRSKEIIVNTFVGSTWILGEKRGYVYPELAAIQAHGIFKPNDQLIITYRNKTEILTGMNYTHKGPWSHQRVTCAPHKDYCENNFFSGQWSYRQVNCSLTKEGENFEYCFEDTKPWDLSFKNKGPEAEKYSTKAYLHIDENESSGKHGIYGYGKILAPTQNISIKDEKNVGQYGGFCTCPDGQTYPAGEDLVDSNELFLSEDRNLIDELTTSGTIKSFNLGIKLPIKIDNKCKVSLKIYFMDQSGAKSLLIDTPKFQKAESETYVNQYLIIKIGDDVDDGKLTMIKPTTKFAFRDGLGIECRAEV
jgi:hypothetical protein